MRLLHALTLRVSSCRLQCLSLLLAGTFVTTMTGCQLVDAGRHIGRSTARLMRPNPTDYDDDESVRAADEWTSFAREARGERPVEREQFLQFSSPKAESINRSLGYEPWEAE